MILYLFLILLTLFAALGCLLVVLARFFKGKYARPRSNDETHFVTTSDGWRLALHHFHPNKDHEKKQTILLVHGLGGNSRNYDFSERQSMPRFLADLGYDTWTLDMRGAGMSTMPSCAGPYRFHYDFHDYLEKDLPVAISYVCEKAGGKIHYVGHSMGGMLAYSLLATPLAESIASCVILASPAKLEHFHFPGRGVAALVLRLIPSARIGLFTAALAPLYARVRGLQKSIGFHPDNLYPGDAQAAAAGNQDDVPSRLILQMNGWVHGDVNGGDGGFYKKDLEQINTPTLFIVGRGDKTAPVESVRHAYERAGSTDKKFIVAGVKEGFHFDYEHVDLVLGRSSREDIYPLVADWVRDHS